MAHAIKQQDSVHVNRMWRVDNVINVKILSGVFISPLKVTVEVSHFITFRWCIIYLPESLLNTRISFVILRSRKLRDALVLLSVIIIIIILLTHWKLKQYFQWIHFSCEMTFTELILHEHLNYLNTFFDNT